ncbi:tRNA threonylcarbamoyladenosine biosynthesis protein TsaE [Parapedobacter composti]|uniref:tRNA threonylcarbamoyladenosine biosynthesis protein TsaE n=1 Tax=Parapedobacter composti TaxID=623281 RepID=A0A1I1FSU2_9SPHI|nr:tRNA (adenosine(37)-N6)-threonylcarbamoyltransferase complex ATPase subunit type 1 TsaE [Parapedobacter composti]SFC02092.1 tRNA threonylcarbamoyladenosine biosynthesis protein TsaE [Parapedobacter composti]
MDIAIADIAALPSAAAQVLAAAGERRVFLFYGEMGAGKTTFIKAICKELGVTDAVSSPTFAIVNEYVSPHGPVYHFDFYRIKSEQEAMDMGYEEYFYSGRYCLVEWPEKIAGLLPSGAVALHLTVSADGGRNVKLDIR